MTALARSDVTGGSNRGDLFRYGEAYTVSQAARLADVAPAIVRRWLTVYQSTDAAVGVGISFLQLIELVVVGQFRKGRRPIPLDRLRRAHAFARERLATSYPFASLDLHETAGRLLHAFDEADPHGTALTLDVGGQWALPGCVSRTLERIDFSRTDRLAERWFPAGRDVPIVLDPHIGGGRLTVRGTGVTIDTIYGRFLAGDSIEFLADDYDLDGAAIQEAIRYADRGTLAVA